MKRGLYGATVFLGFMVATWIVVWISVCIVTLRCASPFAWENGSRAAVLLISYGVATLGTSFFFALKQR